MATHQQFCSFFLDGLFFGVEVDKVQEVIRFQETTRVPLAPDVIGGLINLRGQIVTAVELRKRLQLRERDHDQNPMNVVIRTDDGVVSLLVDEIGDVVDVDSDQFEPPPDTLETGAREAIRGAFKLKDRLMLHLDTECVMKVA